MYQYFEKDLGELENIIEPGEKRLSSSLLRSTPAPLLTLSLVDEFVGFWHSINCEEEIVHKGLPPRPVYRPRYFSASLVEKISVTLQIEMNEIRDNSCGSWNDYSKNVNRSNNKSTAAYKVLKHAPVKSQIPVLLLSSRLDFFTPISWAKEVKQNLPNSYWYVSDIGSHDVGLSDPCALTIIRYFLVSPQTFIRQNRKGPTVSCARYPVRLRYEMEK